MKESLKKPKTLPQTSTKSFELSQLLIIYIVKTRQYTFGHGSSKDQKLKPWKSYHSNPDIIISSSITWQKPKSIISFVPMHSCLVAQKLAQHIGNKSLFVIFCIFVENVDVLLYRQAFRSEGQMAESRSRGNNTWRNIEERTKWCFSIMMYEYRNRTSSLVESLENFTPV